MKVRVQFFAQLRDLAGTPELDVDLAEGSTIADLLEEIYELKPQLQARDPTTLIGAGVDFVGRDYQIQPNDRIAIMPPVQGG
jgi:molybdopterin converting factor small subunit